MSLEDNTELQERAQRMLDHCEIANIRVVDFKAKRVADSEPTSVRVSSESGFLATDDTFANRFVWRAELLDGEEGVVAKLKATILVEYDVEQGFEADQEAAEAIAQSTGYFAAYPYVRELFQTGCTRLQLNPLVLGLLLHGSTKPRRVSIPQ